MQNILRRRHFITTNKDMVGSTRQMSKRMNRMDGNSLGTFANNFHPPLVLLISFFSRLRRGAERERERPQSFAMCNIRLRPGGRLKAKNEGNGGRYQWQIAILPHPINYTTKFWGMHVTSSLVHVRRVETKGRRCHLII